MLWLFALASRFLLSLKRLLDKVAGAVVRLREASDVRRWWVREGEEKLK